MRLKAQLPGPRVFLGQWRHPRVGLCGPAGPLLLHLDILLPPPSGDSPDALRAHLGDPR